MNLRLKETLKSLCYNSGLSYGVFWRFDSRNPMLLTLEDAFSEEQGRMAIGNMFNQVHMLGQGIIGQVAFTGKHRWIFSDTICEEWNTTGSVDNSDVFQDTFEFQRQFLSGIKTIVVISVAQQGVLQFGSTQKVLERLEFVDHIKNLFRHIDSVDGIIPSGSGTAALNREIFDASERFASVIFPGRSYSDYGNIKLLQDDSCRVLMGKACSSTIPAQSSSSTSGLHHGSTTSLMSNTIYLNSQFQTTSRPSTEAPVMLSKPGNSVARNPSTSSWSNEGSMLASLERQLLSGIKMHASPNKFSANRHTLVSYNNPFQKFQECSTFTPLYSPSRSLNVATNTGSLEAVKPIGYDSGGLVDIQPSAPSLHASEGDLSKGTINCHAVPGEFRPTNATTPLFKPYSVNNLSQWLAPPQDHDSNRVAAALHGELSQALGAASVSSCVVGDDVFSSTRVSYGATSVQSSVTNTVNPIGVACDAKENFLNVPTKLPADNDLFDSLGFHFGHSEGLECWDDITMPVRNSNCFSVSTGVSECISELDFGSMMDTEKGFFAEFGLEQLLDDVVGNANSVSKGSSGDQMSTTTITGPANTSMYSNQVQMAGLSCLGGNRNAVLPEHMEKTQKEVSNSRVSSWIDDCYSINAESAVRPKPKRPEEPAKVTRKRARPGESTRPRPKDRQQIQDRVKELREIVPNGAKCSIDALLDRTIKHMLFLQNVTKYADKFKQADEPKIIGEGKGVVLRDNSSGGGGGATWAFEVGGQTMVCPIIVEDLSPPGQMLVEMLCEERGFFLEIADIIRGFGLTILKGVMEVREDKIWARFIIEANRDVTRMDIFLSLVELLQQTATGGICSSNHPRKVVDSGVPLFTNYQKSPMLLPISLGDKLQ